MKYAINVPNFGAFGDPQVLVGLAREAEAAGWDGFFVWDHMLGFEIPQGVPITDPWIALAGAAATTSRIRLGTMVTPLARRRPWKVARETVALDHLSGGRLVLGVGLGVPPEEFSSFGENPDPVVRGDKLDEGLAVLTGLWRGELFNFAGTHYTISNVQFRPRPVQEPRIPIWAAATWPNKRPLRRAAKLDGVFPFIAPDFALPTPAQLREITAFVQKERAVDAPFDVVLAGESPDDSAEAAAFMAAYAEAGLTWWQEGLSERRGSFEAMRPRSRQGPPRD